MVGTLAVAGTGEFVDANSAGGMELGGSGGPEPASDSVAKEGAGELVSLAAGSLSFFGRFVFNSATTEAGVRTEDAETPGVDGREAETEDAEAVFLSALPRTGVDLGSETAT
jgi:hypothetical protein